MRVIGNSLLVTLIAHPRPTIYIVEACICPSEHLIKTQRLNLEPMTREYFDIFVRDMLTDPKVVEHYHSYRGLFDLQQIRVRADKDFWENFEESRDSKGFEIWSLFEGLADPELESFVGWAGLLQSSISDEYGGPELQYMIASRASGQGFATEAALQHVSCTLSRGLIWVDDNQ